MHWIATDYGVDYRGIEVRLPPLARHSVRTGLGVHSAAYPKDTGVKAVTA
jgi:hypothetical protein